MKYALISVFDKTNLDVLVGSLAGYTIISTGGTYKVIRNILNTEKLDIPLKKVSEMTGAPEMLDGRVKTLHPMIHGSILYRRDKHTDEAKKHNLLDIDLVVINLYPFEETVKNSATDTEKIEMIDIGGSTMLISSVKNHEYVTVVTDPEDYPMVADELSDGKVSPELRKRLAVKAINLLADYRSSISVELSQMLLGRDALRLGFKTGKKLGRYGENWHQDAWFYGKFTEQLAGPELGYNNYLDMDASSASIQEMDVPAVSVVKHSNPCGYATGKTLKNALEKAWEGDDISAFGSIIGFSKKVDMDSAKYIKDKFVEVLVVPDIDKDALELLSQKKNLRIIRKGKSDKKFEYRGVDGGMLVQTSDDALYLGKNLTAEPREIEGRRVGCVTKKKVKDSGLIEFSIKAVKHLRSNAITICYEYEPGQYMQLGMGCGQPNRLNSVKLAIDMAVYNIKKNQLGDIMDKVVLCSDAFFPFADSVEEIAKHGIKRIIQPGGSIKDKDVIAAADKAEIAMVFTGMRHFRH